MGDAISIRGGIGGVSARTDDMDAVAALLAGVGGALLHRVPAVGAVAVDPDLLATVVLSPGTAVRVQQLADDVVAGPHGLVALALSVDAAAALLVARAELLRLADSGDRGFELATAVPALAGTVRRDLALAAVLLGKDVGPLPVEIVTGNLVGAARTLRSMRSTLRHDLDDVLVPYVTRDAERLLLEHPAATEVVGDATLGAVNSWRLLQGSPGWSLTQLIAATRSAANSQGWVVDRAVDVQRPTTGPHRTDVTSLASLFELGADLQAVAARDREASAVRIVEVTQPGGARAWVVQVPGTTQWGLTAGGDPSDLTSNLALMSGDPAALAQAVAQAMRLAGIRPDEPVLLTGHSQGGIVAAALAAGPAGREFDVRAVVTAGSPIAHFAIPADVPVLSVEHEQDPVPRLDLAENQDRPQWTTVTRDIADELGRDGAASTFGPVEAHDLGGLYAETVGLAERSHDPSVAAFLDVAAPFLQGRQTYQDWPLRRAPADVADPSAPPQVPPD